MSFSDFTVLDERFSRLFTPAAMLHKLATGLHWAEGPAYFPLGRFLVFSDAPNNRMMRYDECNGETSVFRQPSNNTNGNTVDRQGRLISCEHQRRRVTRTEHDGSITILADRHDGRRFNSPNDVVVKLDDSIWFTDPTYGIDTDYEGDQAQSEIGASHLYRIDAKTGAIDAVGRDFVQPNGLAFSPDERKLYVADTGRTHRPDGPAHIRVFDVDGAGKLARSRVFADCTAGLFDGFRIDTSGRIWTSAFDGVHCYDPDGTLIGKVNVPEIVANVCFGGPKRNVLYICGTTSLYSVKLFVGGHKTF
ncbi:MAG: SMP-30/gluconolactonase/LRE family protein [Proteobacteria bacterium]|nr:SMP-30/gluconolactonase/LRE family protein [Pseudomonadota bacterium]